MNDLLTLIISVGAIAGCFFIGLMMVYCCCCRRKPQRVNRNQAQAPYRPQNVYAQLLPESRIAMVQDPPFSEEESFDSLSSNSSDENETTTCFICWKHLHPERGDIICLECCQNRVHEGCFLGWLEKHDGCPSAYCQNLLID